MNQSKIIIVIPTYNNPDTIKDVVYDVLNHDYKVIVIDDGSDLPIEALFTKEEQEKVYFVRHEINKGKGEAIISGTKKAKELGYTNALSMDGDGQHLASEASY